MGLVTGIGNGLTSHWHIHIVQYCALFSLNDILAGSQFASCLVETMITIVSSSSIRDCGNGRVSYSARADANASVAVAVGY